MSESEGALTGSPVAEDRRKHQRKAMRGKALMLRAGQQPLPVRILNIGTSGMGVLAPVNLPPRATCTIVFTLPMQTKGTVNIEVHTVVVHSLLSTREHGFNIGLHFMSLSDIAAPAIAQFLEM